MMQYFSTFPSSPLFSSQPNKKKLILFFFFSSLFFQDPFLTSFFLKWKIVVLGITSNSCMVIRSFYSSEAYCSIYKNVAKVHAKMMMVMMNRNPNECPSAFWICPKSSQLDLHCLPSFGFGHVLQRPNNSCRISASWEVDGHIKEIIITRSTFPSCKVPFLIMSIV